MEEYKSNSHKSREREREKLEPVVTKSAKTKKKNELQKMFDILLPDGIEGFKQHLIFDVILPNVRDAFFDIVKETLYRDGGPKKDRRPSERNSYDRYYKEKNASRSGTHKSKSRYSYDDVVFDDRADAEEVLDGMIDYLKTYDFVSVADMYELSGIESDYTDNKFGWDDLRTAKIIRERDGDYYIRLPRPVPID